MTEENIEEAPVIPLPQWHWLGTAGMWAFGLGLAAVAIAYFLIDPVPPVPTSVVEEIVMRAQIESAQTMIELRFGAIWIGEKLIAGGFFMWLAGRMIDAFRHPKFY